MTFKNKLLNSLQHLQLQYNSYNISLCKYIYSYNTTITIFPFVSTFTVTIFLFVSTFTVTIFHFVSTFTVTLSKQISLSLPQTLIRDGQIQNTPAFFSLP